LQNAVSLTLTDDITLSLHKKYDDAWNIIISNYSEWLWCMEYHHIKLFWVAMVQQTRTEWNGLREMYKHYKAYRLQFLWRIMKQIIRRENL